MEQNHPNQSTKISFLNQHVADLFQGKNSSIGEALYGNHDFRISFKNSGCTFCNDFKSATSLELFHMDYVILDWYSLQLHLKYSLQLHLKCYQYFCRMFVIHTYEQCPFVISYLIFNEFVATYPAFVQI